MTESRVYKPAFELSSKQISPQKFGEGICSTESQKVSAPYRRFKNLESYLCIHWNLARQNKAVFVVKLWPK